MWINWNDLPESMKNEQVRHYYKILKKKQGSLIVKRGFDVVASLVMLILLSWLFLILAIAIKVDSHGPVFYRQVRVTTGNRDFRIFKFRTMVNNADKIGSLVTTGNDSRITRVGAKIRKCRLDEIPQLFNIIGGDMSFVGTRPEVEKYVKHYTDEMKATLLMPAGLTSRASIAYKDEARLLDGATDPDAVYINRVLPEKMKYNLEGIEKASFKEDLYVLAKTIFAVMK